MTKADIRLVALDLDGTLLTSRNKLPTKPQASLLAPSNDEEGVAWVLKKLEIV